MRIRIGDIAVALIIAAAGVSLLAGFVPRGDAPELAIVTQDNIELARFELGALGAEQRVEIDAPYHLVIQAEEGQIRFIEADCPDQVCVHTGWLVRPGQVAACVPSGVLIRLEGENRDDLDVILR